MNTSTEQETTELAASLDALEKTEKRINALQVKLDEIDKSLAIPDQAPPNKSIANI